MQGIYFSSYWFLELPSRAVTFTVEYAFILPFSPQMDIVISFGSYDMCQLIDLTKHYSKVPGYEKTSYPIFLCHRKPLILNLSSQDHLIFVWHLSPLERSCHLNKLVLLPIAPFQLLCANKKWENGRIQNRPFHCKVQLWVWQHKWPSLSFFPRLKVNL